MRFFASVGRAPRAPRARRAWLLVVAAAVTLVPATAGCSSGDAGAEETGGQTTSERRFVAGDGSITVLDAAERKAAPEVTGQTLDGTEFSLAEHRGKVVVLNVWASWCAPCRAEAPGLERLWQDVRSDGEGSDDVQFVGVDVKDSQAAARAFVDRFGLSYPTIYDQPGRVPLSFSGTLPPAAIPSTLVIDRQGRVAARGLGGLTETELRRVVRAVRSEAGADAPKDG